MIQQMLAIWSLVPLPFLKPAWTPGSSWFTYCWSLAWKILSITLLACEMSAIVRSFEHSLALPFFEIGMKTDLFQSCGYCWVFQICWHIECSTFTASSFRIWNNSTGIPSPPLALIIVILPKAHLTSHSWCLALSEWSHHLIGEGNVTPLQYSCLENSRDGGAWWAAVYGVAQSQTWLKQLSNSSSHHYLIRIQS